jgi:mono/diheme cytochrome c family protein
MTWRIVLGTVSMVITMILLGFVAVTEQDRMASFATGYTSRRVEVGGSLFEGQCAVCHGLTGQGVPAKGPALNTPELFDGTRLTEARFAGTVEDFIQLTIAAGRPRMSEWAQAQGFIDPMPTWGQDYGGPLRPDQVEALVAYIMNWGAAFETGDGGTPPPAVVGVGDDITQELPAGDAANGETLATSQGCAACHITSATGPAWLASGDPEGAGIGTRAETRIEQADYTGAATSGDQYLFESIVLPDAYLVPDNPAYVNAATGQSLMPHTYGQTLDAQMMADLIAYMQTLE